MDDLVGRVCFVFSQLALSRKGQDALMEAALGLTEVLGQHCVPVNCNIWGHMPLCEDIPFLLLCS